MSEVKDLEAKIERQTQAKNLLRGDTTATPVTPSGPRLVAEDGTVLRSMAGAAPMVNYDAFDAYASVLAANGVPNALIGGVGLADAAMKAKTGIAGDNSILVPPGPISDLDKYYTSTLTSAAVVGDFSMLAWGLRTGATLEVTRTGGDETYKQQVQTLFRLYFRGDAAVLRPTWFCKITGLPTAQVAQAPAAPADHAAARGRHVAHVHGTLRGLPVHAARASILPRSEERRARRAHQVSGNGQWHGARSAPLSYEGLGSPSCRPRWHHRGRLAFTDRRSPAAPEYMRICSPHGAIACSA
jgi:hypothetical protein